MRRLAWWLAFLLGLGGAYAYGQTARWHRYAQSRLDPTTVIDVVKDVYSQRCYAVYRVVERPMFADAPSETRALASLGEVPCEATRK